MRRVDLKTGFLCNNNCLFCVQAHKKKYGNRTTEELKKEMDDAKKTCDEIVFTGGEVTIRKDFLELVNHAKESGYKNIQIQTNGRMFSNLDFCKKTIEAGATEFSPAMHGYNEAQHDYLTQAKGSFRQTVKGIMNLKRLGQKVITNTVIVKPNYRNAKDIAKLLVTLGVDQFQLAFVHPVGNAYGNFENIVPVVSIAAPYIHEGLDVGIRSGVTCMAEAMPYCFMQGYEDKISEKVIPETEIHDVNGEIDMDFKSTRIKKGKVKFEQCRKCSKNEICEGPWKEYPQKFGDEEFVALE